VLLAGAGVAATAAALIGSFDRFKAIGSIVGTSVSALFLFVIAGVNLIILGGVWRSFRRARQGAPWAAAEIDLLLDGRGLLARLCRPLFRLISESWHMYPLGFLFGLGFDTASEVALLAVAATAAAKGVSLWAIMVFPALFAAAMTLIDATDGLLMLGAYDWAFVNPVRKLYYNLAVTLASVVVAVLIGGIETLGLLGDRLALEGAFWNGVAALNSDFTALGAAVIGLFAATWIGSIVVYRWLRLDEIRAPSAEH
jgi:high-affinity nickel-transport protein